jgi:hypothetical protein
VTIGTRETPFVIDYPRVSSDTKWVEYAIADGMTGAMTSAFLFDSPLPGAMISKLRERLPRGLSELHLVADLSRLGLEHCCVVWSPLRRSGDILYNHHATYSHIKGKLCGTSGICNKILEHRYADPIDNMLPLFQISCMDLNEGVALLDEKRGQALFNGSLKLALRYLQNLQSPLRVSKESRRFVQVFAHHVLHSNPLLASMDTVTALSDLMLLTPQMKSDVAADHSC